MTFTVIKTIEFVCVLLLFIAKQIYDLYLVLIDSDNTSYNNIISRVCPEVFLLDPWNAVPDYFELFG